MTMSGRQKEHNIGLQKYNEKSNLSRVLLQVGSSENANSPTFMAVLK
jgi:hypothetical protein